MATGEELIEFLTANGFVLTDWQQKILADAESSSAPNPEPLTEGGAYLHLMFATHEQVWPPLASNEDERLTDR